MKLEEDKHTEIVVFDVVVCNYCLPHPLVKESLHLGVEGKQL